MWYSTYTEGCRSQKGANNQLVTHSVFEALLNAKYHAQHLSDKHEQEREPDTGHHSNIGKGQGYKPREGTRLEAGIQLLWVMEDKTQKMKFLKWVLKD
jgi:hypothetical protein